MIALVTARSAAASDPDLALLVAAFDAVGVRACVAAWDDDAVEWERFDAAVLRSTWDYADRFDEFLGWLTSAAASTRLVNSADVIRWNADKHYLAELAEGGVPIVPTTFVEIGELPPEQSGHDVCVVKPAVGASAQGAQRCASGDVGAHVSRVHTGGRAALVQPYLELIDEHAETSLIYVGDGGELVYDHAISKGAVLSAAADPSADRVASESIGVRVPSAAEFDLAAAVLSSPAVSRLGALMYARVDVAPTAAGPVLMELELVEPSLYLEMSAGAAQRTAQAWMTLVAH